MSKQLTRRIERPEQIPGLLNWAQQMLEKAITAGPALMVLGRESKSREQERKYHVMINDIWRQCFRANSFEEIKALMVKQFADELEQAGTPLRSPGSRVWDWKAQELVYVRPSTTKFRKGEAMEFIEFLYSVGSEYEIRWSDESLAIYDEMRKAKAA